MYDYQKEKQKLFTAEGFNAIVKTRDGVFNILKQSGVITMDKAMNFASELSDSFQMIAVVDFLVESNELIEVNHSGWSVAGQHRIFRKG